MEFVTNRHNQRSCHRRHRKWNDDNDGCVGCGGRFGIFSTGVTCILNNNETKTKDSKCCLMLKQAEDKVCLLRLKLKGFYTKS